LPGQGVSENQVLIVFDKALDKALDKVLPAAPGGGLMSKYAPSAFEYLGHYTLSKYIFSSTLSGYPLRRPCIHG
jgi:hypothetical protein